MMMVGSFRSATEVSQAAQGNIFDEALVRAAESSPAFRNCSISSKIFSYKLCELRIVQLHL